MLSLKVLAAVVVFEGAAAVVVVFEATGTVVAVL